MHTHYVFLKDSFSLSKEAWATIQCNRGGGTLIVASCNGEMFNQASPFGHNFLESKALDDVHNEKELDIMAISQCVRKKELMQEK